MLRLLKYVVLIVLAFYGLQAYATYSIGTKFMGCLENEPVEGASKPEMEAIAKRAVGCVDGKVNLVERIWFNKEEWIASVTVE